LLFVGSNIIVVIDIVCVDSDDDIDYMILLEIVDCAADLL
jgi:hypothetical protein